jgi:hypothetical protein
MSKEQKVDIKQRIRDLVEERNRFNKPDFTTDERCLRLIKIYDGLICLWESAVLTSSFKGTSAIAHQLEKCREEIVALRKANLGDTFEKENEFIIRYEYNLPEKGEK